MDIIDIEDGLPQTQEQASMVQQLTKAEIDTQIATAHKFPRSVTKVARNVLGLATLSVEAAKKCTYALPRGRKPITGPSIRLAEIVFSQWGNCRGGARVVHVDKENGFVEAEGIFHDLETNAATVKRVRRRIFDKDGHVYNDDMILVTGNAACSIAFRNAVLGGVPEAIWDEAYQNALRTIKGDVKTLPERRTQALTAMAAFGLTPEDVWAIIGIDGERDCSLEHLVTIGGLHNSLKEGEITVESLLENAGIADKSKRKPAIAQKKADPEKKQEPAQSDPKADASQEQKAKSETDHDPETGEVVEEDKPKTTEEAVEKGKAAGAASADAIQKHMPTYNMVQNDLADVSRPKDIADLLDMYQDKLLPMKAEAPEMYDDLIAAVNAAEKDLANDG